MKQAHIGAGSAANSEYPETAKANAELASRLGAEAGGVGSNQPNTANQEYQANTHGQQGSNRSNKEAPTKPGVYKKDGNK